MEEPFQNQQVKEIMAALKKMLLLMNISSSETEILSDDRNFRHFADVYQLHVAENRQLSKSFGVIHASSGLLDSLQI